jgi:chemotaxis signal transduction protein
MVIIQAEHEQWVFLADEVLRVHRVPRAELRTPPSTLPRDASLAHSVFQWEGRTIGLLDGLRLMNALRSLVS